LANALNALAFIAWILRRGARAAQTRAIMTVVVRHFAQKIGRRRLRASLRPSNKVNSQNARHRRVSLSFLIRLGESGKSATSNGLIHSLYLSGIGEPKAPSIAGSKNQNPYVIDFHN
jgi:hypothetical protein